MLRRVYSKNKPAPAYESCQVCESWFKFSNFRVWMCEQDWEGKELDKDILGDGKLYSPETCCFVPKWLNSLLLTRRNFRGPWPLGVHMDKASGSFQARLSVDGVRKCIGRFTSPEDASRAYQQAKTEYVTEKMLDYPDARVRDAVLKKVSQLC